MALWAAWKPLAADLLHLQPAYTNAITFDMEDGPATIGASQHRPRRWSCQSYKAQKGRRLVGMGLHNPKSSPAVADVGPPCKQLLLRDEVMLA